MAEPCNQPRKRVRSCKRPEKEDAEVNAGIEVQHRQNGKVVSEGTREFPGQSPTAAHARVGLSCSVTQNMGDYNSVKVGCWVEMPCKPTEMHMDETRQNISEMLDRWIEEELDLATGAQPSAQPDHKDNG